MFCPEYWDLASPEVDERQYCSPGFNLAVGCLMRSRHGQFPEYHTSADDLDFVRPQYLTQSYATCLSVFEALEHNKTYVNRNPKCEPQLGKRGVCTRRSGATKTPAPGKWRSSGFSTCV